MHFLDLDTIFISCVSQLEGLLKAQEVTSEDALGRLKRAEKLVRLMLLLPHPNVGFSCCR